MRLLLDTHILLWWLADDLNLNVTTRDVIAAGVNDVFVSAISIAEIATKKSLGKLIAPDGIAQASRAAGFQELDFSTAHAGELGELPWRHCDPFDRMLICQARVERLTVVTANEKFSAYDVELLNH